MPPLFTSTSLTTFIRQMRGIAKYIHQPATAISRTAPKRTINTIGRVRGAVNQAVHETFPSLSTPAHQLHHTGKIKNGAKNFGSWSHNVETSVSKRSLGRVGQGLQGAKRPQWGHGRSIPTSVGLGTARGFASGPSGAVTANTPIVLRAFSSMLSEKDAKNKALPRASRYSPYVRKSCRRQRRNNVYKSIDSSFLVDLQHYFPLGHSKVEQDALPLLPEALVTPEKTTVLAIPLSPSLEALLCPTNELSYHEASLGVSILARLTKGVLPIHSVFSLHASTRVIPLLTKLESLGVLDYHPHSPTVEGQLVQDASGRPDVLRLVFKQRSCGDVRALLGESLRRHEQGQWWALWEEKSITELSQGEQREIMGNWDERNSGNGELEESSIDLVYPTLEVSTIIDQPFSPSTFSHPSLPPVSLPSSPIESSVMSPSLTTSLFSSISSEDWSIPPSEADSDVDSVFSSDAHDAWNDDAGNTINNESESRDETNVWWAGAGEGFGFVSQPW
nr:hypothetical protein L203_03567 [Cryptococcus depauperatus CBS 7841]